MFFVTAMNDARVRSDVTSCLTDSWRCVIRVRRARVGARRVSFGPLGRGAAITDPQALHGAQWVGGLRGGPTLMFVAGVLTLFASAERRVEPVCGADTGCVR